MLKMEGPKPEIPPLLIGALTYVAITAFLVMVAADKPLKALEDALSTPLTAAWCAIVAGQVAVWAVLLRPILRRFAPYRSMVSAHKSEIVGLAIGMVLLFALLTGGNRLDSTKVRFPVAAQKTKVFFITAVGFIVAFPCLVGMRLASIAASRIAVATDCSAVEIEEFRSHREDLDWFLSISGLLVAGSTLSTGIVRNALNALNNREVLSSITVILYGAFCSALIAAIYVPAFSAATTAARRLISSLVPLEGLGAAEWIDASEKRLKLRKLLGVDATVWERLTGGIAVLSPLAGSAISLVFSAK